MRSNLNFEYVPLTFISDKEEIKKQIKNTLILIYLFEKYNAPVRLEELIEGTQYGYNASALEAGRNKFLRISDIHESKVNWETVPYCNCDDEETYLLKNDDILIARTGGTTGKSFKIDTPPLNAIYAGYLIRIRAKETVNPNYIYLFLHSFAYWSQIVNLNEGNFRPKANAENLKALILPNCPKNIQDEIVQISQGVNIEGYEDLFAEIEFTFNEYDKTLKIESLLNHQLTLLSNLNQAILQEAVQGKLLSESELAGLKDEPDYEPAQKLLERIKAEKEKTGKNKSSKSIYPVNPVSDNLPFEIPKNWVWCRLGDLALYSEAGKSYNAEGSPAKVNEWAVIKTSAITSGKFIEDENKRLPIQNIDLGKIQIQVGDIIFCRASGSKGLAGKSCIVEHEAKTKLILSDKSIRFVFFKNVCKSYIQLYNSTFFATEYYNKLGTGKSTSMNNIVRDDFNNLLIPLPPLSEQKRIVAEIEKQMAITKQLKEQVLANKQATEQLLKALLHQAFEVEEMEMV